MKEYEVSIDTSSFYVTVKAENEEEARKTALLNLWKGEYDEQMESREVEVGNDVDVNK